MAPGGGRRDRSSQVQHLKPDPAPPGFGHLLPSAAWGDDFKARASVDVEGALRRLRFALAPPEGAQQKNPANRGRHAGNGEAGDQRVRKVGITVGGKHRALRALEPTFRLDNLVALSSDRALYHAWDRVLKRHVSIRVHLAALGYPLAGDSEYGGREEGITRPMLHAWRLRLRHPRTGAEMSFEAQPPADFEGFWSSAQ